MQGTSEGQTQLFSIKRHPRTVGFNHLRHNQFRRFVSGKTLIANAAFAATAYGIALVVDARIDYLGIGITAKRAFHSKRIGPETD